MEDSIVLKMQGRIARVTLNRPSFGNALNSDAIDQLLKILRRIERDEEGVRVVVLEGAGKHFMAGADLTDFKNALDDPSKHLGIEFESRVVKDGNQFPQILERMSQPVIAKVNGCAAGGGAGLALAADFIVFGKSSSFLFAHSKVGLSPDNATGWLLTRLVGERLAKRFLMFGSRVTSEEAERLGMVDRVVDDADLEKATVELAEALAALPRIATRNIKRLVNNAVRTTLPEEVQREALWLSECVEHPDFREAVTAFLEKRTPRFK